MPTLTQTAANVWRDFNTAGLAASGQKKPTKADTRTWGTEIEGLIDGLRTSVTADRSFSSGLINGQIVASVAANALTFAIKTQDTDADPSAGDPVYAIVPDGVGGWDILTLTAATSITISNGSTLGVVANSQAFRIWLAGINDAGTFRLAAINPVVQDAAYPLTGGALSILPLNEGIAISSTAEGGIGGADSAGVIYSGVAVAAKYMRVLGFATYENGLAAVGAWAAAPSVTKLLGPGTLKPGGLVQRVKGSTGASAISGTTLIPYDDTIPQITEGIEMITQAIVPTSKANVLRVRAALNVSYTVIAHVVAALFQDATAGALAAKAQFVAATNAMVLIDVEYMIVAGTTTSTTFRVRAGGSTAGTIRLNGASAARLLGGQMLSSLEVEELMG